ncbi:amino acid adenylation domain-containing protein [Chromobacterium amazonense]|uniref:amino acid adenylation domain-containing protein n=1 Tax=Chromobacterium amazonense TaxID=1382803 RepID=UPI0031F66BBF
MKWPDGVLATDGVDWPYQDVVSRFEWMVSLHGDRTALRSGADSLDYRTLDRLSDRLAGELAVRGVAAGDCVGVAGRYGLQTAVALLGILKAGAHYACLDEALPGQRLRGMVDHLAARHAVCVGDAGTALAAQGLSCLRVADLAGEGVARPSLTRGAESIAYVNFSSGSTGQPKAIACVDRGIVRLCVEQPALGLDASTVMLVNAPLSFDASTLEIWGALLNGGQCVFHDERLLSPTGLRDLIRDQGVNTLWLTSALFNTMVDLDPSCMQGARQVLAGGEALSAAHVRRAMRANPGVRFLNGYGPTENTTFTACHLLSEEDLLRLSLPIGRPINGTGVAICDASLRPLPPGQIGELVAFGAGLAHGYLGDAELTNAKFRTLELNGAARRVYLSGDLARLGEDGLLEYHGRMDKEVKINGFRIDLAELENYFRGCPQVRDCALIDVAHQGGKLLLAAIVPAGASGEAMAALEAGWLDQLPPHERPHALFAVDALPLTANGKLDRVALLERWREDGGGVNGLDAGERGAAALWRRHVGHPPSSRRSDFFADGGNSLLALRMLAEAERLLGARLPMEAFYQASRFDKFCRWLAERGAGRTLPEIADSALIRVEPDLAAQVEEPQLAAELARRFPEPGRVRLFQYGGDLFLAGETAGVAPECLSWLAARHRQAVAALAGRPLECELNPFQRSMALDELINGNLDGNSMFYQLRPALPWSDEGLRRASDAIHRRHPLLNARVSLEGERFVFLLDEGASAPEPIFDEAGYANEEAFRRRYLHHPHSVFERGYLRLVRAEAAGKPVFGLWLHHVAADAHFIGRLLPELRAVLESGGDCGEADFSFAQQNWRIAHRLESGRDEARRYWAGLRPRLDNMGADMPPRLAEQTCMAERDCAASRAGKLLNWAVSRQQGLLPVFAALLQRVCERTLSWRPRLVSTTCTQRDAGISPDGAGCYINLLPLALDRTDGSIETAIAAAGREALHAMAAGCLPYEELAEACGGLGGKSAVLINIVEERQDHPDGWAESCNQLKVRRPLTLTVFLRAERLARLTLAGRMPPQTLESLLDGLLAACDSLLDEEDADVRDDLAIA